MPWTASCTHRKRQPPPETKGALRTPRPRTRVVAADARPAACGCRFLPESSRPVPNRPGFPALCFRQKVAVLTHGVPKRAVISSARGIAAKRGPKRGVPIDRNCCVFTKSWKTARSGHWYTSWPPVRCNTPLRPRSLPHFVLKAISSCWSTCRASVRSCGTIRPSPRRSIPLSPDHTSPHGPNEKRSHRITNPMRPPKIQTANDRSQTYRSLRMTV